MKGIISIFAFFFLFYFSVLSQELTKRVIAEDMQVPWEMRWGHDNYLWVSGIDGMILRVNPDTGARDTILSQVPNLVRYPTNEPGLLGFDLLTKDNRTSLFAAYTFEDKYNVIYIRLIRYHYDTISKHLVEPHIVLDSIPGGYSHVGCRVKCHADTLIYLTIGDGGRLDNIPSQNLQSYAGKTLRIKIDGTIPPDNPFPQSAIWTWGHRNHQGLCITSNNIIYSTEHGTQGDDELNVLKKGGNYGWPFVEGFCDSPTEEQFCKDSQIIEPQRAFTPTLAIAGIEYYDGKKFPQWKNSLLVASLRNPFFSVFPLNVNQDSVLDWWKYPIIETSRLRSVCVSPDGRIFLGKSQGDHYGTKNNSDNAVLEIVSEAVNIVDNPKAISRPEAIHSYIKDKTLIITNAWQLHSFKVYNNVGELITYSHNNDNNHSELQIPINYQGLLFISLRLKNGFFQNKALISIIN